MKRGEVWTVAGVGDYTGKLRPAVIVQDDRFDQIDSITVCPITSNEMNTPLFRPVLIPNDSNGLRKPCRVMVDKIAALPKSKLGKRIGQLDHQDMVRINRSLVVFLGIAETADHAIEQD